MPEESSNQPDRAERQPHRCASADAARQARLARRSGAGRAGDARAGAERAAGAPQAELPVVRARPDRDQLAVGAVLPTGILRRTAREDPVQSVLPRRRAGRSREVDLLQGRHGRGDVHDEGALPAHRHQGDADEAVRDRGAELLERHRAVGPAEGKARRNQRQADDDEPVGARRAVARLRPDAVDRRAVRADRPARRQSRWRDGGARKLREIPGAARRPGKDPRHVRRRRRDRRGQGGASGDRRLPANPERYGRLGGACRTGCCSRERPGRARRCSREPWPGRRTRPSSRSPPRSSSRRSWAWAPRACATCSPRPRRPRRRSCSSTSSTRSGARARARCRSPAPTTSASRRSTRSSPSSTASSPPRRWSCSPPPTAPTCSTRRCCRPGRFDRRVTVQPPDRSGRRKILEVHTRSIPMAASVDLDALAAVDAGHGRRGPREPRQRGRAAGGPPRPREGRDGRLHRLAREDHARLPARHHPVAGRPRANRLPRVRPCARGHAHRRAPIRFARCRSFRAGWRSA